MATGRITINVERMPELIASLRQHMADILRSEAREADDKKVAAKLNEIADIFEVGGRV